MNNRITPKTTKLTPKTNMTYVSRVVGHTQGKGETGHPNGHGEREGAMVIAIRPTRIVATPLFNMRRILTWLDLRLLMRTAQQFWWSWTSVTTLRKSSNSSVGYCPMAWLQQ
jgi:hypothetical protein